MQYNYDLAKDEFVENPSGQETGDLTGNRVWVLPGPTGYSADRRIRIEIDADFRVIAALDRLIQQIQPYFVFPVTKGLPEKEVNKTRSVTQ